MNAHKLRNKFFMVCTGKETENMFMMPIDTGNKAIKTENFEFNSGITMLADVPGENEEALMYQGRYYRLSHIYKGTYFIRLNIGVNAVAHSCNMTSLPSKRDEVGFVVTRINDKFEVAEGIITRMIKRAV